MSFDEKFLPVQHVLYQIVRTFFTLFARLFGYPKNPGIPTLPDLSTRESFLESLPIHKTVWPPVQRPETWLETIFGPTPKLEKIPRYIYESQEEGFYNFYILNYKNIYFLPDWLSEFIQVRLHICFDLTVLESIREVLFVALLVFSQLLIFRITLAWFLVINPYSLPWCYLVGAVDWAEELFQGMVPSLLGVNVTGSIFLGLVGMTADGLNHLVFTMPFLPSEGEETKLSMNQEMKDVIVFHYLPILWYRYPIPNEIREFWYQERPDILKYMQKAYQDLEIQFLPDRLANEVNPERFAPESIASLSTAILSKTDFHFFHENLSTFLMHSFERFF